MNNKDASQKIIMPILSILLAFILGGLLLLAIGQNPIAAYYFLFKGALGNMGAFSETIIKAIPLIFTGLAATFAYRCGLFNLGGEGQFIMGAIASIAFVMAVGDSLNPKLLLILSIIIGTIAGGLWGLIPGLLKAYLSLNEMILTILLNYIATLFMGYLFAGPLMEANIPQTAAVPLGARLTHLIPGTRVHTGIILALLCALFTYYFLFHTSKGFQLRAIGLNQDASKVSGFKVKKIMILSFVISGAIAGFGGAVELHGTSFRLMQGFAKGFGFDGVAIALIGQLNPIGTVIAAFFFAILRTGANTMQIATGVPTTVVGIIQGLVIVFVITSTAISNKDSFKKINFKKNKKEAAL